MLLGFHLLLPSFLSRWHVYIPDEDAYQNLGQNLARRGVYALDQGSFYHQPGAPNSYFAPAWPALLAVGQRLGGGLSGDWIVLGLVWCLASVTAWKLGRSLGLGPARCSLLLAWLTTNPLYLYYHAHLMTEPLTIALAAAILAMGVELVRAPRWGLVVVLGVLSGLGHLSRTSLLLPMIAIWIVAATCIPPRRFVAMAMVCLALHLAIVAPWLAQMGRIQAGTRATELKLGINLFVYNNNNVRNPYQPVPGETLGEPPGLEQLTPAERDATLFRLAVRGIVARPDRYLLNCLRRACYLFSPWPNFTATSPLKTMVMCLSTIVYFYVPWGAILFGFWRGSRLDRGQWVVLLSLLLWYAFHILVHASVRQRLPSDLWVSAFALSIWSQGRERGFIAERIFGEGKTAFNSIFFFFLFLSSSLCGLRDLCGSIPDHSAILLTEQGETLTRADRLIRMGP